MLTHGNLMAVLSGVRNLLKGEYAIGKEDRHLSYLPLAHSFERYGERERDRDRERKRERKKRKKER